MANAMRAEVDRLKTELQHLLAQRAASGDGDEWLRALLQSYTDRFLHDNDRVWSLGTFFVPVALAAFGVLASLESPKLWQTIILAVGSSTLLGFWIVIAENLRAFQQKSEAWLVAIQEVAGLQSNAVGEPKVTTNILNRLGTFPGTVQQARWFLFVIVVVAWALIGWLQSNNWLSPFGQL